MKMRLLSILLCIGILVALLPIQSMAAGASSAVVIPSVALHITEPVGGGTPGIATTSSANVTITSTTWWMLNNKPHIELSGEPFNAGNEYRCLITVMPTAGNSFTQAPTATINSENAILEYSGPDSITCYLDYVAPSEAVNRPISGVALNIIEPVGGASPSTPVLLTPGVTVSSVVWYNKTDNIANPTIFQNGNTYTATFSVTPMSGSSFIEMPTMKVNDKSPTSYTVQSPTLLTCVYEYETISPSGIINGIQLLVAEPVHGQTPGNASTSTPNTSIFTTEWFLIENNQVQLMTKTTPFVSGKTYRCSILVNSAAGFSFSKTPSMSINARTAQPLDNDSNYIFCFIDLTASNADTTGTIINVANISVPIPVAGATPPYAVSSTTGTTVSATTWYLKGSTTPITSAFEAGRTYQCKISIVPQSGFSFASTPTATVNGNAATLYDQSNATGIICYYEFTVSSSTAQTGNIAISVNTPIAGASTSSSYATSSSTGVLLSSTIWHNKTDNYSNPATFEYGKTYTCIVTVVPQAGFTFPTTPTATINGYTPGYNTRNSNEVVCTYDFVVSSTSSQISTVTLSITQPVVGAVPSTSTSTSTTGVTVNSTSWYNVTDNSYNPSSFVSGKTYKCTITVTPIAGYTFSESPSATLNGNTPHYYSVANSSEITFEYDFTPSTSAQISTVVLTVTKPVVGATPSNTASTSTTGVTVSSATWRNKTDNTSSISTYIAGKTYTCTITVYPSGGYSFTTTPSATINGSNPTSYSSRTNSGITCTYDYVVSATGNIISSAVLSVTSPTVGAAPSSATTSTTGTSVYSTTWHNQTDNVANPTSFEAGKTYRCTIIVRAADGYSIGSNPTATISGATATVSSYSSSQFNCYRDFASSTQSAAISPTSATFDKKDGMTNHKDIVVTLTPGNESLNEIKNDLVILEEGNDYTVYNNIYTLKTDYLLTLDKGQVNIVFAMSDGSTPTLTLMIIESSDVISTPVTPTTPTTPTTPITSGGWANPFTDVHESDWFFEDVKYAHQNGLFSGTSTTTFSPSMSMTRGMIVTVLGRLEDIDITGYIGDSFDDVVITEYYAPYIKWASVEGIVNGVGNNRFEPETNISRQDIVVILHNYAKMKNVTLPVKNDLIIFSDFADISTYAVEAVSVIQQAGIVNGLPGKIFNPLGNAQRDEVSAILHRFAEIAK